MNNINTINNTVETMKMGNANYFNSKPEWLSVANSKKLHSETKNSIIRNYIIRAIFKQGSVLKITPLQRLVLLTMADALKPVTSRFGRMWLSKDVFIERTGMAQSQLSGVLGSMMKSGLIVKTGVDGELIFNFSMIMDATESMRREQADAIQKSKLLAELTALGVNIDDINIDEVEVADIVIEDVAPVEGKENNVPENMVTSDDFFADCA